MTCGDGVHAWTLGLMAFLGQPWEGPVQGRRSLGVCNLGSCLSLYPCAPLGLCRWAFFGLMAPVMGLQVAWQGIVWGPPPVIVSLNSFAGVQMRFIT